MALATEDHVEDALRRTLTSSEDVSTLLESASDRVVGYLGYTPDPVPAPVARVVGEMVAEVLNRPGVTNADYQASGYNVSRETPSVHVGNESRTTIGPWISKSQRVVLDRFRTSKTRGVFSIKLEAGS